MVIQDHLAKQITKYVQCGGENYIATTYVSNRVAASPLAAFVVGVTRESNKAKQILSMQTCICSGLIL